MQLVTRAHTKHYFISIFIIVSMLFITFSSIIYSRFADAQKFTDWTIYNYEVSRQSRRILISLVDMETGVRGYMLTHDRQFLEPYLESRKTIQERIRQMWDFTKNDESTRGNIDIWLTKIEHFSALLSTQLEQLQNSGQPPSKILLDRQRKEMDSLRDLLDEYITLRTSNLSKQIYLSKQKQNEFKYMLIAGTVLAILGILLATMVILALLKRSQTADDKARKSEDRFMTVINGVNDGLYDYNLIDNTIYYSPSFKSMLGYSEEEYPNTLAMFKRTLHPEDSEKTWETYNKYAEGNLPTYRNVFRLRHKSGHWIWVLSRGVGIHNAEGVVERLIGTHTDISDQKLLEEDLKQLNQEMETFTYITSHDLRAPLVNLRGFAKEMVQAINTGLPLIHKVLPSLNAQEQAIVKTAFEEDLPESLNFIEQSVEKMDKLTTAVLDLTRIGKREYKFELVDVDKLVKRCLDALAYEITQKNIHVAVGVLPNVQSDSLALEQVMSNIIDNAIKYLDPTRAGVVQIAAAEADGTVLFSVKDNGRGIAAADKERVFQIFRRARNTMDVRGVGLGMTYVQATLRKLGGRIWFESEPETGTIFYFTIPKVFKLKEPIHAE